MSEETNFDFNRAMRGDQLTRLRSGKPTGEDIAGLRRMLQIESTKMAEILGVKEVDLTDWESGTQAPPPICILLAVITRHPSIVVKGELPLPG
jgi:DNA-binding transcriptional regulator YiaG